MTSSAFGDPATSWPQAPRTLCGDEHGAVWCWGSNSARPTRRRHDDALDPRRWRSAVSGAAWSAVAAGHNHSCALTSAGAVWCWGDNGFGQLGDGTTSDRTAPVAVSGLGSGVVAVSAGYGYTCALTSAGAALCWGVNSVGQLGDGTTTNRSTPTTVSGLGSGVAAIDAGDSHTCAVTSAGAVLCWGVNTFGQLGDGTTTDRSTPTAVSDSRKRVAETSRLAACTAAR